MSEARGYAQTRTAKRQAVSIGDTTAMPGERRRPAIVCCAEASAEGRRALDTTVELARRLEVRPVIVRVGEAPMWVETERAELVVWADSSNPPADAEYVVVYGMPAEAVVGAAEELGAVWIVVGSSARRRLVTALRRSSCAGIIARSSCPVLVVPAARA